jgi:hypothetical protein
VFVSIGVFTLAKFIAKMSAILLQSCYSGLPWATQHKAVLEQAIFTAKNVCDYVLILLALATLGDMTQKLYLHW